MNSKYILINSFYFVLFIAAKIIAFYAIFYIALAALFAICMKGLLSTIDDDQPKWQLEESLIGTNPGLGFRPMAEEVEQGSLIWYDVSNQTQIKSWSNILDDFLARELQLKIHLMIKCIMSLLITAYNDSKLLSNGGQNQKHCDFDSYPRDDQVCALDISQLKDCSSSNGYGFNKSAPCVFLKLNRIFGWKPQFYNDINDLPKEMPESLKDHIKSLDEKERNQIWVTCQGESPADEEIIGDVQYFPTQGFPGYYYPFKNTPGYLSPLVAVKFIRPKRKT